MMETVKYLDKVGFDFRLSLNVHRYLGLSVAAQSTGPLTAEEKSTVLRQMLMDVRETVQVYEWLVERLEPELIVPAREDVKKVGGAEQSGFELRKYVLTEALVRAGMFGVGKFASKVSVTSLLDGATGMDLHFSIINKLCQLALVRDARDR